MKNNIGRAHYEQLLSYAKERENDGWFYGNRSHFEKRHAQIVAFLEEAIERLDAKQQAKAIEKIN